MRTFVSRFLLSFMGVVFSGGLIVSQKASPEKTPPQVKSSQTEVAAPLHKATPKAEATTPPKKAQQKVPQEEKVAPSQEEAQQVVAPEEEEEEAAPHEDQQVPPEEAAGPEAEVEEDTEMVGVVGAPPEEKATDEEAPEEVAEEAPPEEKEIPKPEEEAEVISEDKPAEVPVVPSELKGIDTLEVTEPGGNWLVKRMWWEKAEEKMEKIDSAIDTIMESRMVFFERRDKADSDLFDSFYFEIGMDQGQLEEISSYMIQELKDKREKKHILTKEELAFFKTLEAEKEALEEVKVKVEAIRKLDDGIDDALGKLVEQINLSRKYRREAQELFKNIAKVLDHEKARELYFKMDASWQNINGIQRYINGKFTEHFNQLLGKANEQVIRIKILMADLEKKGLGFREQLKKLKNQEKEKEKKELERKRQEERKEKLEEEISESPGVVGVMLSTIGNSLRGVWNWFLSLGTSTWNGVAFWWKPAPAEPEPVPSVRFATKEPAVSQEPVQVEEKAAVSQAPEAVEPVVPVQEPSVPEPTALPEEEALQQEVPTEMPPVQMQEKTPLKQ